MLDLGISQAGVSILSNSSRRKIRRMFTAGDNLAYVVMPLGATALAIRFQREIGGAGGTDIGAPWAPWRRTGVFEIADMNSDPASPLFVYGSDVGAFDYALTENTTFKFGGSYHGGESVVSEQWYVDGDPFTPSTPVTAGSTFTLMRTTMITWAAGKTLSVTYRLDITGNGTITESAILTSAAAFTAASYIGMDIFARQFDEVRLSSAIVDVETIGNYDLAIGDSRDLTYRSLSTGHTIRIQSDIPDVAGYLKTFVASQSTRIKHYPELASTAGAAFGTRSYSRTITFGKGEANKFAYSAQRDGLSGASRTAVNEIGPSLDTAVDPDALLFDRSRSAESAWIDRYWTLGNLERGNWRLNLNYTKTGTGSVGTQAIITAEGASIVSPMASFNFADISDHADFAINDDDLLPITLHIRMGTATSSADRLRITSFNLEKLT